MTQKIATKKQNRVFDLIFLRCDTLTPIDEPPQDEKRIVVN